MKIIFNGSGTLLQQPATTLLLKALGKEKEAEQHQQQYEQNKQQAWGIKELAQLFKGLDENTIQKKAKEIAKQQLQPDAKDAITRLKKKGHEIHYLTSDIQEIAMTIKDELELDDVFSNELEYFDRTCLGKLGFISDRNTRAQHIEELAQQGEIIIIGNSITATPSIQHGRFIAIKPKDGIEEKAEKVVNTLTELADYILN